MEVTIGSLIRIKEDDLLAGEVGIVTKVMPQCVQIDTRYGVKYYAPAEIDIGPHIYPSWDVCI